MDLNHYEIIRNENVYDVFDEDGNKLNTVVSSESFVKENFANYQFVRSIVSPKMERRWRDKKLKETDSLMSLPDYPNKLKLEEYRQILRDWPDTPDFPNVRPISFEGFMQQSKEGEAI